ncbi:MAG TPA: response regulator [Candidatus Omnitrophota bacterium]|nr:response regulator [Candidatus Omnitrophota bacterium]
MKEAKKVLIIDDEPDFLRMIKLALEKTGNYEVITSPDAKGIVDLVNLKRPDVILLDILLPGITGFEALEMLNGDPLGASIPVIALTALSDPADMHTAYKEGIVDYITKPVEWKDVIGKIEKAVSFKR